MLAPPGPRAPPRAACRRGTRGWARPPAAPPVRCRGPDGHSGLLRARDGPAVISQPTRSQINLLIRWSRAPQLLELVPDGDHALVVERPTVAAVPAREVHAPHRRPTKVDRRRGADTAQVLTSWNSCTRLGFGCRHVSRSPSRSDVGSAAVVSAAGTVSSPGAADAALALAVLGASVSASTASPVTSTRAGRTAIE
jgi:hypothetical protein